MVRYMEDTLIKEKDQAVPVNKYRISVEILISQPWGYGASTI